MNSSNKLSLKQFIKNDSKQTQKQKSSSKNLCSAKQLINQCTFNYMNQTKLNQNTNDSKNKKSLKLNTLPNQKINNQENQQNQKFLFRSTWQGDYSKEQLKGVLNNCQSPTFATQILSNGQTGMSQMNLFPSYQANNVDYRNRINENNQINDNQNKSHSHKKNRSNSRKNHLNKSLKKFIGDCSNHRPSLSTITTISKNTCENQRQNINQKNNSTLIDGQEQTLYHISMLQLQNQQLKRDKIKINQKLQDLKIKYDNLKDENQNMKSNKMSSQKSLMSNQELFQKMQAETFWKFYLKAQKMIRTSSIQNGNGNNASSISGTINFMKQLQALREISSQMKKQIKIYKKNIQQKQDQIQKLKDKVNITQTDTQQMRLKCIAYQSTLKKIKEQNKKFKTIQIQNDKQKLKQFQIKIQKLTKQLNKKEQSYSQLKILYEQCDKQRINQKKKVKSLDDQIVSLNKQINALKTQMNLLQLQRQDLLASNNKKQLIEKQRLKQRNFQLQKQMKNILIQKQQQSKYKQQNLLKYQKQIQMKDSQVKELDNKVCKIKQYMQKLQKQKKQYENQIENYKQQIQKYRRQYNFLSNNYKELEQLYKQTQQQKQLKLNQLCGQINELNSKLSIKQKSISQHTQMVLKLTKQNKQKDSTIKLKQQESQKLKQCINNLNKNQKKKEKEIEQQQLNKTNINIKQYEQKIQQMQEYIHKLEDKHNEALQMYQNVCNQKVQIEMELQVLLQNQSSVNQKIPDNPHSKNKLSFNNHQSSYQELIESIKSMLMIKEQIIKKILIFCPEQYKQMIVDYIYHGDMVEEKYFDLIFNQENIQNNLQQQNNLSYMNQNQRFSKNIKHKFNYQDKYQNQDSQYYNQTSQNYQSNQQQNQDNYDYGRAETSTVKSYRYNQTRPYQKNKNKRKQNLYINNKQRTQQQIFQLMEKFINIGKLIQNSKRNRKIKEKYTKRASHQKYYPSFTINDKQNSNENYNFVQQNDMEVNRKSQSKGKILTTNIKYEDPYRNLSKQANERKQNYQACKQLLSKKSIKAMTEQQKHSNFYNRQVQENEQTPPSRRDPLKPKNINLYMNNNNNKNNNFNHGNKKNINLIQMMQRMKAQ